MINQHTRTEMLLGREGLQRLKGSTAAVFGVGGVGSHCIEALARSGVGRLVLIDNDRVSTTNINRQSIAYHSTVGQYKTEVMKKRIEDIDPGIQVEVWETFALPDNLEQFFEKPVDYIIDAIDTVSTKIALAELAWRRNISIISSMGTGNKLHPELFEIADIYETSVCPLCRVMRRELKNRGIPGLRVVYSREKPISAKEIQKSVPSADENADPERMGTEKRQTGRPVPGSVSFVPPVAGLLMAGEVIRELSGINEKQK